MNLSNLLPILLALLPSATAYYTMSVFAPFQPSIDAKIINARDKSFVIGARYPSTYCGLDDPAECPRGNVTLVNADMTLLGAAVPGGQFIYVAPDGSISYPSAHSSLRPPGATMGGFRSAEIASDCAMPMTIVSFSSSTRVPGTAASTGVEVLGGYGPGLWACPVAAGVPLEREAVLKARTRGFRPAKGCVAVDGVRIRDAGSGFGAWAYD